MRKTKKEMEKKQYIMPSVRVKAVNADLYLLAGSDPQIGDDTITNPDDELSKEVDMPTSHDVWED